MTSSNQTSAMKNFAARFAKALAGKPELPQFDVDVRPVRTIVEDLTRIPESGWWKYAFGREPMNGRFKDEERIDMYEKAVECGRTCAREYREKYGDISLKQLAEALGVDLVYRQRPQSSFRVLFADFQEPKTIHIYQDGLAKGEALLEEPGVKEAFGNHVNLADILLAHELYHVIELKHPDIWSSAYRIPLWKIGFFTNTSPVAVLSEIAAMAFAKEINQLHFSPYVLDAFLVYGYNPATSSALYEEMMAAAQAAAPNRTHHLLNGCPC